MIKSSKQLLEESEKELSIIRKRLRMENKSNWFPEKKWYSGDRGLNLFADRIEEYDIKESEVLEKIKVVRSIDNKNDIFPKITHINTSKKLYNKLIEMSEPLKEKKFLYSWYMDILKLPVITAISYYNMDQLMILEYLLKNKKTPPKNAIREKLIMSLASMKYMNMVYKQSGGFLTRLLRSLFMGI
jgi:hypothetical protein